MKKFLLPVISLIGLFIAVESHAAISFINGSHDSQNDSTTVSPAEPTNCDQEDDFIVAYAMWDDFPVHSNTITDPADFTQIDEFLATPGSDSQVYVGFKIRGSDAGNGYTFSVGTSDRAQGTLLCFRGVDTTTPLDIAWVRATHFAAYSNLPNNTAKAITSVTDNSFIVIAHMMTSNLSDGSAGPPSGFTTAFTADLTLSGRGIDSAYLLDVTAGVTTPGVWTHTDTNGTADPRNFTIALREASSSTAISAAARRRHAK